MNEIETHPEFEGWEFVKKEDVEKSDDESIQTINDETASSVEDEPITEDVFEPTQQHDGELPPHTPNRSFGQAWIEFTEWVDSRLEPAIVLFAAVTLIFAVLTNSSDGTANVSGTRTNLDPDDASFWSSLSPDVAQIDLRLVISELKKYQENNQQLNDQLRILRKVVFDLKKLIPSEFLIEEKEISKSSAPDYEKSGEGYIQDVKKESINHFIQVPSIKNILPTSHAAEKIENDLKYDKVDHISFNGILKEDEKENDLSVGQKTNSDKIIEGSLLQTVTENPPSEDKIIESDIARNKVKTNVKHNNPFKTQYNSKNSNKNPKSSVNKSKTNSETFLTSINENETKPNENIFTPANLTQTLKSLNNEIRVVFKQDIEHMKNKFAQHILKSSIRIKSKLFDKICTIGPFDLINKKVCLENGLNVDFDQLNTNFHSKHLHLSNYLADMINDVAKDSAYAWMEMFDKLFEQKLKHLYNKLNHHIRASNRLMHFVLSESDNQEANAITNNQSKPNIEEVLKLHRKLIDNNLRYKRSNFAKKRQHIKQRHNLMRNLNKSNYSERPKAKIFNKKGEQIKNSQKLKTTLKNQSNKPDSHLDSDSKKKSRNEENVNPDNKQIKQAYETPKVSDDKIYSNQDNIKKSRKLKNEFKSKQNGYKKDKKSGFLNTVYTKVKDKVIKFVDSVKSKTHKYRHKLRNLYLYNEKKSCDCNKISYQYAGTEHYFGKMKECHCKMDPAHIKYVNDGSWFFNIGKYRSDVRLKPNDYHFDRKKWRILKTSDFRNSREQSRDDTSNSTCSQAAADCDSEFDVNSSWFLNMGKLRSGIRHEQSRGDWQFERAKGRRSRKS